MRALMKLWSLAVIGIPYSAIIWSSIISEPCSCCHVVPGLTKEEEVNPSFLNVQVKFTNNALGINMPSQTWDQGPCPRSWHNPAISTQSTSRSVIASSRWLLCKREARSRDRYATPGSQGREWYVRMNVIVLRYLRNARNGCAWRLAIRNETFPAV